jgi:hypothetical protein
MIGCDEDREALAQVERLIDDGPKSVQTVQRALATERGNEPNSTSPVKWEEFMKKAKRKKSRSSSKRAGAKPRAKRATKAKRSAKSKSLIPKAGKKLKRVAKKAAVAAGLAAVGTALSELAPEQKGSESEAPNETETKHERSRR